jgi:hypothetical protein
MKHLTIGTWCVIILISLLFVIENIFSSEINWLTFGPSLLFLIITGALISFGQQDRR